MKAYVINLERRTDRWARMEQRLQAAKIPFERIVATTPETLPGELVAANEQMPSGLRSTRSELACFCSHVRALKEIANGTDEHAIVLEDDAVLAKSFSFIAAELSGTMELGSVVRLERESNRIRLRVPSAKLRGNFQIFGLSEFDAGASAYFIGRNAAQSLVDTAFRNPLPFDHWLFDLQFAKPEGLTGHQLVPAVAIQERVHDGVEMINSDSDLHDLRTRRLSDLEVPRPNPGMSLASREYTRVKRRLHIMYRRYKAGNSVFYPSRKVSVPFADELAGQSEVDLKMPNPKIEKRGANTSA